MRASLLDDRRVLEVSGPEVRSFLHNVVTCAVDGLPAGGARYGGLLTPQGKIITDFLLLAEDGAVLLDVPAATVGDLLKRLTLYRLRARIAFAERTDRAVAVLWNEAGDTPAALPGSFADPRLAALGRRLDELGKGR